MLSATVTVPSPEMVFTAIPSDDISTISGYSLKEEKIYDHEKVFNMFSDSQVVPLRLPKRKPKFLLSAEQKKDLLPEYHFKNLDKNQNILEDIISPELKRAHTAVSSCSSKTLVSTQKSEENQRKINILNELSETERTYLRDLKLLVLSCFKKLDEISWLSSEDKYILMRNANELLAFQTRFESLLQKCIKEAIESIDICDRESIEDIIALPFIDMETEFQVYTHYCTQHDGALLILSRIEKRKEIYKILQDLKTENQDRLDIRDYLIKPVQRICKYPNFLAELLKIEKSSLLERAHNIMASVAADINAAKWYLDNLVRSDIFYSSLNSNNISVPSRIEVGNIVLSDVLLVQIHVELSLHSGFYGVFLFNEHIFIVKVKRSGIYSLKYYFKLCECVFSFDILQASSAHAFSMRHRNQNFVFGTSCLKELLVWKDVIFNLSKIIQSKGGSWRSSMDVSDYAQSVNERKRNTFDNRKSLDLIFTGGNIPLMRSGSIESPISPLISNAFDFESQRLITYSQLSDMVTPNIGNLKISVIGDLILLKQKNSMNRTDCSGNEMNQPYQKGLKKKKSKWLQVFQIFKKSI